MFWVSYVFLVTWYRASMIYGLATPDIDLLCPPLAHLTVAPGHATLEVVLCVLEGRRAQCAGR